MAENYKRLYEQMKKLVAMYQDEIVPGLRKTIEEMERNRVEVVRCKDCIRWMKDVAGCTDFVGRCAYANYMIGATGYCLYGERKEN